jgi:DNA-binding SARP family transcriptional activator
MFASIALLGGFDVRLRDGASLDLPTQKYKALLAYLAVPPGQSHPREKLIALLWGDLTRQQGRTALRQAIWVLRHALDSAAPPLLSLSGDAISLNAAAVEVDVVAFEQACAGSDIASFQRAAALYSGDFLAGLAAREEPFEDWLAQQRERLAELALSALARLFAQQRKSGLLEDAIQTALRLIAIDPLQEPIHRALMELYVQLGRRAAALRHYRTCAQTFQRELGIDPGAETQALYQSLVGQRLPAGVPPPASSAKESETPFTEPVIPLKTFDDGPLVGRSAELASLDEALDQIAGGRGQVAVMFGEAGIGKSRLIGALAARSAERGMRVLLGHCYESEKVLAFGPWINALARDTSADDRTAVAALRPNLRAALARIAPRFADADTADNRAESDYRLIFEAVTHLLAASAGRQPVVLILEDVHWSDEVSLRLFSFIARRFERLPLLLVFTARREELDDAPAVARTLDDLDRDLAVLHLSLAPLSHADTTQLVANFAKTRCTAADLERVSERIWRLSEGNPFLIVETLRALRDEPTINLEADIALSERARRVITRRLDQLAPSMRQLLAIAAVIGRDFTFSLLQRASELSEAEALAGLEELVRRGLLLETGDRFDVSHDSIRRVAIEELLPPRRRLLHRRVAETLEALHGSDLKPHLAALSYQYAQAEVWDNAAVYLDQVGTQAWGGGAYREGTIAFNQVLDATEHVTDNQTATELAFDTRLRLVMASHVAGNVDAMAEHVRAATQAAAKLDDKYRDCLLQIFTSQCRNVTCDHAGAIEIGQAALARANALEKQYLQDLAHIRLGTAYLAVGDYRRAIEHNEVPVAGRNPLPYDPTVPTTHGIGNPREREALPTLPNYFFPVATLVAALCDVGRYDEAKRHAEDARRIAGDRFPRLAFVPWAVGWQRSHRGHLEESIEPLEHALELLREQQFVIFLPQAIATLALVFALLGRVPDAARLLDGSGTDLLPVKIPAREPFVFPLLAKALWFVNRASEAQEFAERALRGAIEFGEPGAEAEARLALAMIGAGSPEWDTTTKQETLAHLHTGLALAQRLGMRPLQAHYHYEQGIALERAGLRDEAHTELERALDLYRAMDMRFWLKRAEAAIVPTPA